MLRDIERGYVLVLPLVFQGTPTMVGPFACRSVGDALYKLFI